MKYNLFLDDIRDPYIDIDDISQPQWDYHSVISAYHYTFYAPFRDEYWEIVRSYDEFVNVVTKYGVPELVSFDHDLGTEHYNNDQTNVIDYLSFEEKTGYDCAKWLCNYCQENNIKFPKYYVHSMNPVGTQNIKSYILNYKKHVENQ